MEAPNCNPIASFLPPHWQRRDPLPDVFKPLEPNVLYSLHSNHSSIITPHVSHTEPSNPNDPFRCAPCKKTFTNEATWSAHLHTSRHKQTVKKHHPLSTTAPSPKRSSPQTKDKISTTISPDPEALDALRTLRNIHRLKSKSPDQAAHVLWSVSQILWKHGCVRDTFIALTQALDIKLDPAHENSHQVHSLQLGVTVARLRISLCWAKADTLDWIREDLERFWCKFLGCSSETMAYLWDRVDRWSLQTQLDQIQSRILDRLSPKRTASLREAKAWNSFQELAILAACIPVSNANQNKPWVKTGLFGKVLALALCQQFKRWVTLVQHCRSLVSNTDPTVPIWQVKLQGDALLLANDKLVDKQVMDLDTAVGITVDLSQVLQWNLISTLDLVRCQQVADQLQRLYTRLITLKTASGTTLAGTVNLLSQLTKAHVTGDQIWLRTNSEHIIEHCIILWRGDAALHQSTWFESQHTTSSDWQRTLRNLVSHI
ncbi:hypothetical protein IWQ62_001894 [Dispira parvispora]|uniref:C2H2-type domain-containing protein n=1 Tax=Dispira parvispora TaxID=1520584 RepID=A0A9W8ARA1_9FUNG|nr:hypothetical protein IWQ62_001894 [Dispira parvispora]